MKINNFFKSINQTSLDFLDLLIKLDEKYNKHLFNKNQIYNIQNMNNVLIYISSN